VPTDSTVRPAWGKRLLALALAVLVTLLVAEGLLRLVGGDGYAPRKTAYPFVAGRFGGPASAPIRVFQPNGVVRYAYDGDPLGTLPEGAKLDCPLNAAGLRGPLPGGVLPNVLFVGDSFTFGEGVLDEDGFVQRLGAGSDGTYAVVNAGIPGYGTLEQRVRLPSWLQEFSPDLTVLVFNLNDPIQLEDSLVQGDRFMNAPGGVASSRLWGLLQAVREDKGNEAWYRSYYLGERAAAWRQARMDIGRMRAAAEAAGGRFAVVVFPLLHALGDYPFADLHATVAEALRQDGIAVLDLLEVFRGQDARSLWVHPTDHHPNSRAHRLAAEAMAPFVRTQLAR
jgi:lysophospholipase L1-like esterase